jgi:hypothetical protein
MARRSSRAEGFSDPRIPAQIHKEQAALAFDHRSASGEPVSQNSDGDRGARRRRQEGLGIQPSVTVAADVVRMLSSGGYIRDPQSLPETPV